MTITERLPPVNRTLLGRTLLIMNQSLFNYIEQHGAYDMPLIALDDPYESEPNEHIYIEIESWPRRGPHMTYGRLAHALQGLWICLYIQRRSWSIGFDITDEVWGQVGIG